MARYSDIDTSIWEDLQGYSKNAKLLYIYVFSNSLCRDSGLYKISLETILLHTKLKESEFDKTVIELNSKIAYDKDKKVMFVAGKLKRRLSGLKANPNLIKAIQHDLEVFSDSYVTSLFCNKYEGALREIKLTLSLPLPLPLLKEESVRETKPPKNLEQAKEIYLYYEKTIKKGGSEDAIKSIAKLLKTISKEDLIGRINAYKQDLLKKGTGDRYYIQANNFFGQAARYKDYEPIIIKEYKPKPDSNCEICQGKGFYPDGQLKGAVCLCVK